MTTDWVACDDLDIAAAFTVLGMVMRPEVQVQADTRSSYTLVYLSAQSLINPELRTAPLLRMLRSGELEKVDPEHRLIYALQAIKNFHAMKAGIAKATRMVLVKVKGSQRAALIREDISSKGLAMTERFLKGGIP